MSDQTTTIALDHYPIPETLGEKAIRKTKENPLVPIGALATCTALVIAMTKMRKGHSREFNNWLRVRVIAQGLTIAAIVAGAWGIGGLGKQAPPQGTSTHDDAQRRTELEEELRRAREARERAAFEERVRLAEEETRNEEAFVKAVGRGPKGAVPMQEAQRAQEAASDALPPPIQGEQRKKTGWGSWFGWK